MVLRDTTVAKSSVSCSKICLFPVMTTHLFEISSGWEGSGWRAVLQKGTQGCWLALAGYGSGSQKSKPYRGMHQTQHKQLVKRSVYPSAFSNDVILFGEKEAERQPCCSTASWGEEVERKC